MTVSAIASAMWAVIKAFPKLMDLFRDLQNMYINHIIGSAIDLKEEQVMELRVVIKSIRKAETDEERAVLSKLLFKLKSNIK